MNAKYVELIQSQPTNSRTFFLSLWVCLLFVYLILRKLAPQGAEKLNLKILKVESLLCQPAASQTKYQTLVVSS